MRVPRKGMRELLRKVTSTFQAARVVVTGYFRIVTGYFRIVSGDSGIDRLALLLGAIGFGFGGPLPGIVGAALSAAQAKHLRDRSLTFHKRATERLKQAVDEVDRELGGGRVVFADPDFKDKHAVFADESLLWGIELDTGPADDEDRGGVEGERAQACELVNRSDPDRSGMTKCIRASVGHPNVKGARRYSEAIIRALEI